MQLLPLFEFDLIASMFPLLLSSVISYTHPTLPLVRLPSGRLLTSLILCVSRSSLVFQTNTDCLCLINQHVLLLHVYATSACVCHCQIACGYMTGGKKHAVLLCFLFLVLAAVFSSLWNQAVILLRRLSGGLRGTGWNQHSQQLASSLYANCSIDCHRLIDSPQRHLKNSLLWPSTLKTSLKQIGAT